MQPDPRRHPVSFDCGRRNVQQASDLRDRKTSEKPQLNDMALSSVEMCQLLQSLVQRNQIRSLHFWWFRNVVQGQFMPTTALSGAAPAGVLDQNLTHQLRRNGEKVFTVFELSRLLV